jgi:hypothetical protein
VQSPTTARAKSAARKLELEQIVLHYRVELDSAERARAAARADYAWTTVSPRIH